MRKFSILLPTRQRADTLRFALQTAVAQEFDDVEILVHESGNDPKTAEVVAEIGDSRTRHVNNRRAGGDGELGTGGGGRHGRLPD